MTQSQPLLPVPESTPSQPSPESLTTLGDTQSDQDDNPNDGESPLHRAYIRATIGTVELNSRYGHIKRGSYVWSHSDRFTEACLYISDPSGQLLKGIASQSSVEVEMGFIGGAKRKKFTGEIYRFGRRGIDTTVVYAVDPSASLAQQQTPGVSSASDAPADEQGQNLPAGTQEISGVLGELLRLLQLTPDAVGVDALIQQVEQVQTLLTTKDMASIANLLPQMMTAVQGLDSEAVPSAQQELPDLLERLEILATQQGQPSESQTSSTGLSSALTQLAQVSQVLQSGVPRIGLAEQLILKQARSLNLIQNTLTTVPDQGRSTLQQTQMAAIVKQAAEQGNVVSIHDNTVEVTSPGMGTPSGLVLDYIEARHIFVREPEVLKRTALQLQSGYGAVIVQGYNVDSKTTVSAISVVPGQPLAHPTGNIEVPEWGNVNLDDKVYQGSVYSWADVTRNGERVPESQGIMEGAVRVAQVMDALSQQFNGGQPLQINSWYRDPATNAAVGGASSSRHMQGDAVDFYSGNMDQIYAYLDQNHEGGVAICYGSFVHVDTLIDPPRRRWEY